MKNILLIVLFTFISTLTILSCDSNISEDQIQKAIEDHITRNSDDPSTYQFVDMSIQEVSYDNLIGWNDDEERNAAKYNLSLIDKELADIAFIKVEFAHREINSIGLLSLFNKVYHIREINNKVEVIWSIDKEILDLWNLMVEKGEWEMSHLLVDNLDGWGYSLDEFIIEELGWSYEKDTVVKKELE